MSDDLDMKPQTPGDAVIQAVVRAGAIENAIRPTEDSLMFVWAANAAEHIEAALAEMGYKLTQVNECAVLEGADNTSVLTVEEARSSMEPGVIGWRLKVPTQSVLVFADQVQRPGFRLGDAFVEGLDETISYNPVSLK